MEGGSFSRRALGGTSAIVVFRDFLGYGKAYTGACVFIFPMQPLKHFEYFPGMRLLKTDPIIANGDHVIMDARNKPGFFTRGNPGCYLNLRRYIRTVVFQGIRKQVLKSCSSCRLCPCTSGSRSNLISAFFSSIFSSRSSRTRLICSFRSTVSFS